MAKRRSSPHSRTAPAAALPLAPLSVLPGEESPRWCPSFRLWAFGCRPVVGGGVAPPPPGLRSQGAVVLAEASVLLEAIGAGEVAGVAGAAGELAGQGALLAEGADGRPQRRLQRRRLLGQQGLGRVGVADVAAEADQLLLV